MTKTQTPHHPFNDSRDELITQPALAELRRLTGDQALILHDTLDGATRKIAEVHGDAENDLYYEIDFARLDVLDLIDARY